MMADSMIMVRQPEFVLDIQGEIQYASLPKKVSLYQILKIFKLPKLLHITIRTLPQIGVDYNNL